MKKSLFWAAIEQVGPQMVGFLTSVILARLLTPADFGLIAMITIFMALANLFADSGMSQALIQRKKNTQEDETSVFYLNIAMGMGITIILCAASPFIADFYEKPMLIELICLQSIGFTLSSFGIVQHSLLSRELLLKKTAFASFISTVFGGATSVIMAFLDYGVWSLVGGYIVGTLTRVVSLWFISPWRPIGRFSMDSIRDIWKYSFNLLAAGMFTTIIDNLSNLLIGKKYTAADLGYYNRAFNLFYLPVSLMTGIINRVAFPVFSKCQDDAEQLKFQLRRTIKSAALLASFVCFLLAILADVLVPWLLGTQWYGSIKYLQILSLGGTFFPVNVLLITAIKSTGRSDLFLKVEIIKKVIIMIALFISVQFSIEAMAWSLLGTGTIAYFLNTVFTMKEIDYSWKLQMFDIFPTWIIIVMASLFTFFVKNYLNIEGPIIHMLSISAIFTFLVFFAIYIFRKTYFEDIWFTISNIAKTLKVKF